MTDDEYPYLIYDMRKFDGNSTQNPNFSPLQTLNETAPFDLGYCFGSEKGVFFRRLSDFEIPKGVTEYDP